MKTKNYDELIIKICLTEANDCITASGEIDEDETKYPIPDGWAE